MKGRSFVDMNLKHVVMRCEDYYGRHPERDGRVLVGIFIGKIFSTFNLIFRGIFVFLLIITFVFHNLSRFNLPNSLILFRLQQEL